MHHQFKRVIVLLNQEEQMDRLLKRGVEFSQQHNTTLEVLYVHEEPIFDIPDYFLSDEKIHKGQVDTQKIKKEIQKRIKEIDTTKEHAVLVYIDDTVDRVLTYTKDDNHILIISNYHEDITPKLIMKSSCGYWINKGDREEYNNIVLPIELKDESRKSIAIAKHIFPKSKLNLVYDYRFLFDILEVQEDYLNIAPTGVDYESYEEIKEINEKEFEDFVKEFKVEGYFMEGEGLLHEDLIQYIKKNSFDLTFFYHNIEELFFSPVITVKLLEALETDFFIHTIKKIKI